MPKQTKPMKEKTTHCGYIHDSDGICINPSCRRLYASGCRDEWETCDKCGGKGYLPTYIALIK